MSSEKRAWFTNYGQMLRTAFSCLSASIAATLAWPKLQQNQFLSPGVLLFYALVALTVVSLLRLAHAVRRAGVPVDSPSVNHSERSSLESEIQLALGRLLRSTTTNPPPPSQKFDIQHLQSAVSRLSQQVDESERIETAARSKIEELRSELARHADCVFPTGARVLTLQSCRHVPSQPSSTEHYRNKVEFVITATAGFDLEIWTPLWESKSVAVQSPMMTRFHREGPKGRLRNDWEDTGVLAAKLSPGQSVKGWIGLLPPVGEGLDVRLNRGTTGTLVFPLKIEGKLRFEKVGI